MEVTLKRLTKNGAFANEVLFLTQQKAYSFGRISQNDVVLCFPTVEKNHCIIHHNSNGLFVEVLRSLAGVVVNGKKYTTGSMIRLNDKDLLEIGLFKYQVDIKPIVQVFDTETNFTSDFETNSKSIKHEDLSDMTINIQPALKDATGGIEDTDYEKNSRLIRRDESFLSEASIEIKEELILEDEIQEITLDEIHSSMQITIDEEDVKPLLPLNLTDEALADPKTFIDISRDPEILQLPGLSNFVAEETPLRRSQRMNKEILQKSSKESFKKKVSQKPTPSNKQNKTSVKENEISNNQVSQNQSEISKEQSRIFKEKNIVSNKESKITPNRISDRIPREQNKIALERSSIENSENAVKIFQAHPVNNLSRESVKQSKKHSVRKLRNDSARKDQKESSSTERKLRKEFSSTERKLREEFSSTERKLETESLKKLETNFLHQKRLVVTLIDILKNPIPDFPPVTKLPSNSANLHEKSKPTRSHQETHAEERLSPPAISDKTCKSESAIAHHQNINSELKPFVCHICDKTLSGHLCLTRHIRRHMSKYTCNECQEMFRNKNELRKHLKIHFKNNCPECGYMARNQSCLMYHRRKHTGERPFVCKLCRKTFRDKTGLQRHIERHVAKFACNECQEIFPNKNVLRMHLHIHFPPERDICPECGYVPRDKTRFENHRRVHTKEKPFLCLLCLTSFSIKSSLRSHMLMHTGDYPYRCKKCGKGFDKPGRLKIHYTAHGKRHSCTVCRMLFRYKASCFMHYVTHKSNKWKCEICHWEFKREHTLKKHRKNHLKIEGEFNCTTCMKMFNSQKDLIAHCQKTIDLYGQCPDQ